MPSRISTPGSGKVRLITGTALGFQVTEIRMSDPPWLAAYEEFERNGQYVEAEMQIPTPVERLRPAPMENLAFGEPTCESKLQSAKAPKGPERAWHLSDHYSQLASAREFSALNHNLDRPVRI